MLSGVVLVTIVSVWLYVGLWDNAEPTITPSTKPVDGWEYTVAGVTYVVCVDVDVTYVVWDGGVTYVVECAGHTGVGVTYVVEVVAGHVVQTTLRDEQQLSQKGNVKNIKKNMTIQNKTPSVSLYVL